MRSRYTRIGMPGLLVGVAALSFLLGQRRALPEIPAAAVTAEHAGDPCEDDGCASEAGHVGETTHAGEADGCADEHGAAAGEGVVRLTAERVKAAGIATAPIGSAPVAAALTLNGEVQADGDRTARVGSPVTGRLLELRAKVGDRVRCGQTLAVISSRDVADAQSALVRAKAEEKATADRLRTLRALAATGALTRKPLEEAQNAVSAARASVRQAEASLDQARNASELAAAELERKRKLADAGAFRSRPVEQARAEVARAQAELETAHAAVRVKSAAYERSRRLLDAGVAARRDVENAEADLEQARALEKEARTHLEVAGQTLSREGGIARENIHSAGEVQTAQTALRQAERSIDDREAELERARAHLGVAQAVLAREGKVAGQDLLARREIQEAEAAHARAKAEVAAAENGLRALRAAGGLRSGSAVSITITAPIGGIVTERMATPGQAVAASTDLFTLVGGESVWVWAGVYEKDIHRVRSGQPARVSCPVHPGHVWDGRVGYVGAVSDEKTRSIKVRIDLPNPEGLLRPGMFVTVSLQLREKRSALALPVPAVQQMGDGYVVFVARKEGEFERRPVRLGSRSDGFYEVLDGVRAGEPVVTKNAFLLKSELMKDQLSEGCGGH